MNKNFYDVNDASKVFLWALLLPTAVALIAVCCFSPFYSNSQELALSLPYLFMSAIVPQGCFAFILFYYNKKNHINFAPIFNLRSKTNIKNVLVCVLISIIAVFGFVNIINIISGAFTSIGFDSLSPMLPLDTWYWLLINIVLLAVLPAFFEEVIFRGMIFSGLKSKGLWFATIVSAVMFAIIHLSVKQLVFPLIMGLAFGLIYNKTGSLKYSMIVHFCNNCIVLIISYIAQKIGYDFTLLGLGNTINIILSCLFAIVSVLLIWLLIRYVLKPVDDGINSQSMQDKLGPQSNNLLTFSIIVGVVIWIVYAMSELLG